MSSSPPPRILLATTNRGKLQEFRSLLRELTPALGVESLDRWPPMEPPEETGSSFRENARIKAMAYSLNAEGVFVVAEDSGLVVSALNGEPGIHSARYAGPDATDKENVSHLLHRMRNIRDRAAFFVTAAAVALRGRIVYECRGRVDGRILEEPRGEGGFGYDPVFYHVELKRTFAQLSSREKNRVSHRGQAMARVVEFLATTATEGIKA